MGESVDSGRRGKLFFVCGKMAAGKSTLSKELAAREDAVLLGQDELLITLFPEEIVDLAAFMKCSTRIQEALAPHICSLLSKGCQSSSTFPLIQESNARGSVSCLNGPTPSTSFI